jgi:hypothetical protein
MISLLRSSRWAIPALASFVFAFLAVWLILLNSAFVSNGAALEGLVPQAAASICIATALIHFFLARRAYSSRLTLLASSLLAGIVFPLASVALPVIFCVAAECRGFDMP